MRARNHHVNNARSLQRMPEFAFVPKHPCPERSVSRNARVPKGLCAGKSVPKRTVPKRPAPKRPEPTAEAMGAVEDAGHYERGHHTFPLSNLASDSRQKVPSNIFL